MGSYDHSGTANNARKNQGYKKWLFHIYRANDHEYNDVANNATRGSSMHAYFGKYIDHEKYYDTPEIAEQQYFKYEWHVYTRHHIEHMTDPKIKDHGHHERYDPVFGGRHFEATQEAQWLHKPYGKEWEEKGCHAYADEPKMNAFFWYARKTNGCKFVKGVCHTEWHEHRMEHVTDDLG